MGGSLLDALAEMLCDDLRTNNLQRQQATQKISVAEVFGVEQPLAQVFLGDFAADKGFFGECATNIGGNLLRCRVEFCAFFFVRWDP